MNKIHFCPQCGAELPLTGPANFCPECGSNLHPPGTWVIPESRPTRSSGSFRSKGFRLKWWWVALFGLWAGFMVATAGVAIAPSLGKITDPFVCRRTFLIKSYHYSYKPGQHGVVRNFSCQDSSGTVIDITGDVMGWSIGLYSALGTILSLLIWGMWKGVRFLIGSQKTP